MKKTFYKGGKKWVENVSDKKAVEKIKNPEPVKKPDADKSKK